MEGGDHRRQVPGGIDEGPIGGLQQLREAGLVERCSLHLDHRGVGVPTGQHGDQPGLIPDLHAVLLGPADLLAGLRPGDQVVPLGRDVLSHHRSEGFQLLRGLFAGHLGEGACEDDFFAVDGILGHGLTVGVYGEVAEERSVFRTSCVHQEQNGWQCPRPLPGAAALTDVADGEIMNSGARRVGCWLSVGIDGQDSAGEGEENMHRWKGAWPKS